MTENNSEISIEKVVSWLAGGASLCFIVSALYEYSYINGLGVKLSTIPVSISDITIQAFSWLRYIALFLLGCLITPIVYPDVVTSQIADAMAGRKKSFIFKYFLNPITPAVFTVIIGLVDYFLIGDRAHYFLILSFTMAGFMWASMYLISNDLPKGSTRFQKTVIALSVMFLGLTYANAYDNAKGEISREITDSITFSDGTEKKLNILRSYSSGYLVYDGGIQFLAQDEVKKVKLGNRVEINPGMLCLVMKQDCPAGYVPKSATAQTKLEQTIPASVIRTTPITQVESSPFVGIVEAKNESSN